MPKKWNQNAKPAEKLLSLYTILLFTGKEISLTELTKELECSKQSIRRLLKQLEGYGYGKLLCEKKGRELFFRIDRPKQLPKISLTPEGLAHIALCRDFLLHLLPAVIQDNITEVLQQASVYLGDSSDKKSTETSLFSSLGTSFANGYIDYTPFEGNITVLLKIIYKQQVCIIQYQESQKDEVKTYEFAPKAIVNYKDAFYAQGWIVEKGKAETCFESPTNLAVHRIRDIMPTQRTFEHLVAVPTSIDHFGFICDMEEKSFVARIAFTSHASTYIAERIWSKDQVIYFNEDGSLILKVKASSSMEIIAWVLSFGEHATLLEPDWLVEKIEKKVTLMAESHRKIQEKKQLEEYKKNYIETDENIIYADAIRFVKEHDVISLSLLQRHLRFTYNQTQEYLQRMERDGILIRREGRVSNWRVVKE